MFSDLTPVKPVKGPPCTVCQAMRTLPEADADDLVAALRNPEITYTSISEEFANYQFDIMPYTVGNHARGRCKARVKYR